MLVFIYIYLLSLHLPTCLPPQSRQCPRPGGLNHCKPPHVGRPLCSAARGAGRRGRGVRVWNLVQGVGGVNGVGRLPELGIFASVLSWGTRMAYAYSVFHVGKVAHQTTPSLIPQQCQPYCISFWPRPTLSRFPLHPLLACRSASIRFLVSAAWAWSTLRGCGITGWW